MKEKKTPFFSLKRTAKEVKRYRTYQRIIPVGIGAVSALLIIVYVISLLFQRYGSFTVKVQDYEDRKYALSLSESESFTSFSSRLNSKAAKDITNIDGNSLPNNLNDISGEHNGKNYVAYTFYIKNTGESACTYRYSLTISRRTAGIDAAARVRLYFEPFYYDSVSGEHTYGTAYTDYAKPKTGTGGEPEVDPDNRVMTNFVSESTVTEGSVYNFKPGDISKVTVVIWLEGNDPDCTDDILGGQFKLDMIMDIAGDAEGN